MIYHCLDLLLLRFFFLLLQGHPGNPSPSYSRIQVNPPANSQLCRRRNRRRIPLKESAALHPRDQWRRVLPTSTSAVEPAFSRPLHHSQPGKKSTTSWTRSTGISATISNLRTGSGCAEMWELIASFQALESASRLLPLPKKHTKFILMTCWVGAETDLGQYPRLDACSKHRQYPTSPVRKRTGAFCLHQET